MITVIDRLELPVGGIPHRRIGAGAAAKRGGVVATPGRDAPVGQADRRGKDKRPSRHCAPLPHLVKWPGRGRIDLRRHKRRFIALARQLCQHVVVVAMIMGGVIVGWVDRRRFDRRVF